MDTENRHESWGLSHLHSLWHKHQDLVSDQMIFIGVGIMHHQMYVITDHYYYGMRSDMWSRYVLLNNIQ